MVLGFSNRRVISTYRRVLTGAWMRDPAVTNSHVYVLKSKKDIKMNRIQEFESEEHLANNTVLSLHHLPFKCAGTGHVVFHNKLYCNRYRSNRVISYDLKTKNTTLLRLDGPGYKDTFPLVSGKMCRLLKPKRYAKLWKKQRLTRLALPV